MDADLLQHLHSSNDFFFFFNEKLPSVIQLFSCRLRPSTPVHNKCAHVFPAVQNLGRPYWLTLSPMYLWMLVFFTRPHKEERFLFPIYPLVCLSGAVALSSLQVCPRKVVAAVCFPADPECLCLKPSVHLQKCYHFLFQRYRLEHYTVSSNWLALSAVMAFTVLSLSRSVALFRGRQQGFSSFGLKQLASAIFSGAFYL